MFLTPAELEHLTGYRRPSAQRAWLTRNAVPHYVAASGRPVVQRIAFSVSEGDDQELTPEQIAAEPWLVTGVPPFIWREANLDRMDTSLPAIEASAMPYPCGSDRSGIYFLFLDRELEYIGQSGRIRARLSTHFDEGRIPFDRAAFIEVPPLFLKDMESTLIRRERPPFNVRGMPC